MPKGKSWYRFQARANADGGGNSGGGGADVYVYDVIGLWGITAKDFVTDLANVSGPLNVHINSPGGDVFEAIAIYNALQNHDGEVTCTIDGIAASAASVIAMAGKKISMSAGGYMMIHNVSWCVAGDGDDLRKGADVCDKLTNTIVGIYAKRTGNAPDDIAKMMDEETWMDAQETVDEGFADDCVDAPAQPMNAALQDARLQLLKAPTAALKLMNITTKGDDVTLEQFLAFAKANPTALDEFTKPARQEGHAAGVKAEKDRIDAIVNACPDRPQIALESIKAGHDTAVATAAYAKSLVNELTELKKQKGKSDGAEPADVVAPGSATAGVDAGDLKAKFTAEWKSLGAADRAKYGKEANFVAYKIYENTPKRGGAEN
jgi:ATP-dependent protease ClpP protease subunit